MKASVKLRLSLVVAAIFLMVPSAAPQSDAGPTLSYRKVFKDSSPEFFEIKLRENGVGTIDLRQLDDEPEPEPFEVSPALAAKIFELAGSWITSGGFSSTSAGASPTSAKRPFAMSAAVRRMK